MENESTDRPDTSARSWRALSRNPHDRRMSRAEVIDEVEWLIGTDGLDSIAHRLGYASLESLQKALERAGRWDLAHRLEPLSTDGMVAATQLGRLALYDLSARAGHRRRTSVAA